jgi:membrane associated rhomboid family serine protease
MVERSSPTLKLALLMIAVYVFQVLVRLVVPQFWPLAMVWPVDLRPWSLVTATVAHGNLGHLLANLVPMVIAGLLVERRASNARFYAFFLGVGALSSISQVLFGALLFGSRPVVLGASGAVFGLIGYLLSGNRLSDRVIGGIALSGRVQIGIFVVVAAAVSLLTYSPGVALISHFTGLLVGLLAGRAGLLRPGTATPKSA